MLKAQNRHFSVVVISCALCLVPALFAQAPVPPIQDQPQPVLVTDPIETQITADEQPLTSGQDIGFGSWGPRHSFVVPSLRFAETLQSNPLLLANDSGAWRGFSSIGGDAQLVKYFGRNAELRYAGALRYDTFAQLQGSDKISSSNDLLISKRIPFRSWQLIFDNQTQYSQGSNSGASGMEGMGGVVGQLWQWSGLSTTQLASNTIRPDLLPNQSILTQRIGRVSNTTLAEADFRLNSRDILTVAGSYSLLHFTEDILIDTRQASGILGFNHNISPRDSVAVEAMVTHVTLVDLPNKIDAVEVTLLYGRRLTGKLSFDVGAGPIVERGDVSTAGQLTHNSEVDWEGRAGLRYRTRRAILALRGARNFISGAGVLEGAMSSSAEGSASFTLSRNWSSSLNFSVARNEQINSPLKYNNQYTGISFTRQMGFNTEVFASYDYERQTSGSSCVGQTCQFGGDRHVFGIGLAWTARPISIE